MTTCKLTSQPFLFLFVVVSGDSVETEIRLYSLNPLPSDASRHIVRESALHLLSTRWGWGSDAAERQRWDSRTHLCEKDALFKEPNFNSENIFIVIYSQLWLNITYTSVNMLTKIFFVFFRKRWYFMYKVLNSALTKKLLKQLKVDH